MRTAHKTPKNVQAWSYCIRCGKPKMSHRLCECFLESGDEATGAQSEIGGVDPRVY